MEKTVRLNADQREDLVAYLDGELPDEQAQAIDHIIARSEVARHEVEALARTWEMLDILPAVKASDDFASKTMTNLKVMEQPFDVTEQWWYIYVTRIFAIVAWIGALAASAWVGFQITRTWVPNPYEELLDNMPVIQNLDEYQDAGEVDFLRQLKQSGMFDDSQEK